MNLKKIKQKLIPKNYITKFLNSKRSLKKKKRNGKKASGIRNNRSVRRNNIRNSKKKKHSCNRENYNLGDMILNLFS